MWPDRTPARSVSHSEGRARRCSAMCGPDSWRSARLACAAPWRRRSMRPRSTAAPRRRRCSPWSLRAPPTPIEGDEDGVIVIVDPIDHHHPQIQVAQGAGQAAGQLLLTEGDDAPRHGTARRRPRGERVGDWLQGRPVCPGRHPRDDRPPGLRVERVPFGGPQDAGQGELAAIDGGRPQPSYANPAAAQGDLARGRSSAPGLARRLARPLGAAQLRAVLLHQRVQRLLAHAEAQLEEPLSHRSQPTEHRQRPLDGDLRLTRRLTYGTLLHGGSFSFRIFTSPRLPQPGQGRNRRSTSYFQQPVGHPPRR